MPGLTTREASRIEEALHLEEVLVRKFGTFANQVTDPECRRVLAEVQALHRNHYDVLRRQVETAVPGGQFQPTLSPGVGGYPTSVTSV